MTYRVLKWDYDFHEGNVIAEGLTKEEAEKIKSKYGYGILIEEEN